jgi:hypothetical protein
MTHMTLQTRTLCCDEKRNIENHAAMQNLINKPGHAGIMQLLNTKYQEQPTNATCPYVADH